MEQQNKTQSPKEEAFDLLVKTLGERARPDARPAPNAENAIDIMQLLMVLRSHIILIIIAGILGGGVMMFYTEHYITPLYQASIQMIVNAKESEAGTYRTISEVTSAEALVATYATVIKSNRVMEETIKELGLEMNWRSLNGMVAVRPVNNTPVINIVVTGADPELCRQIVTTISQIAPDMLVEAVEAGSCRVISDADCTGYPISPDVRRNVMQGIAAGAVLCAGLIVLLHLLNDRIRSEEQLAELSPMPVLSVIPMSGGRSHHYGYGYGYTKKKEDRPNEPEDNQEE